MPLLLCIPEYRCPVSLSGVNCPDAGLIHKPVSSCSATDATFTRIYYFFYLFFYTRAISDHCMCHMMSGFAFAHISLHFNKSLINEQYILAERNFITRSTLLFPAKAQTRSLIARTFNN